MADKQKPKQVEIEITSPDDPTAKSANNFIVSYIDDEFALDIIYVYPHDLVIAASEEGPKVRGEVIARIAMTPKNAIKLRDKLDEMIKSYEGK